MQIIVILLLVIAVILVIAAWIVIQRRLIQPACRLRASQGSVVFLSATLTAFIFHLLTGLANWAYLPRGPFDRFVEICLLLTLLAVVMSAFAKGFVRCAIAVAGIAVGYLWILVAAWSWM